MKRSECRSDLGRLVGTSQNELNNFEHSNDHQPSVSHKECAALCSKPSQQISNESLSFNSIKQRNNKTTNLSTGKQTNYKTQAGLSSKIQMDIKAPNFNSNKQIGNIRLDPNSEKPEGNRRPLSNSDRLSRTKASDLKLLTDNSDWTTKSVFIIHKQFENASQLKEKMCSYIQKTNTLFQPTIIDDSIICSEYKSLCTVALMTVSKEKAVNFVIDLHRIIQTNLKETVHFQIVSTRNASDTKTIKDNKKKSQHSKPPSNQSECKKTDQYYQVEKNINEPLPVDKDSALMSSIQNQQALVTHLPSVLKVTQKTQLKSDVCTQKTQLKSDVHIQKTQLKSNVPKQKTQLKSDAPKQKTQLNSDVYTQKTQLKPDVYTQKTQLKSDVPKQKRQLKSDVHTEKTQLKCDVNTQKTQLKSDVYTQKTQLQTSDYTQKTQLKSDVHTQKTQLKSDVHTQKTQKSDVHTQKTQKSDVHTQKTQLKSDVHTQKTQNSDVFIKETISETKDQGFQDKENINDLSPKITDAKTSISATSIPTIIEIEIFSGKLDLTSILNLLVPLKMPHIKVDNISVESSKKSKTICKLNTPSRAAAKRISKLINSTKCKVHMRAYIQTEKKCQLVQTKQNKDKQIKEDSFNRAEAKLNRMRKELSLLLESLKSQSVEKHNEKIQYLTKQLEKLFQIEHEQEADRYKEIVILDKIEELEKQKEEFLKQWEILNMTSVTRTLNDAGRTVMRQVGIECNRLKMALPMYARRQDIIEKVTSNQVSVILGETGSGKSTQLVQYLYEAGLAKAGSIVCTQPRKVAAITLAERVAKEMVVNVGQLVGYKTGIKKMISKRGDTKIIFSTDHCLLNECLKDKHFSGYSCIIVDEAHERSIYTDLLLSMIKTCLPKRPDLKVIVTSATIDPEIFIQYFHSTPELRVSGRMFPVDIVYDDCDTDVEFEDHERKAVAKAIEVHRHEEPGDILVFLTSPVEIMKCCEEFQKQMRGVTNFKCFPLHGQLPPEEQKKVFEPLPDGSRKIVFATNSAETSITIDGIKYVIDTGVAKEVKYDAKKNINVLGTHVISKSSADQRKGRAGRTSSGKCFRLYSESGYKSMEPSSKPEILRVHLGQAVLKLAALGIDCRYYDFVESPGQDAIDAAISTLIHLGAMSNDGITELGKWINKLPFDPRQGFLIYHGFKRNLLYDSIVIASLLNNGSNMFYKGISETDQQKSSKTKLHYGSQDGDVFTWLEVYKDWTNVPKKSQSNWCKDKSINYKVVTYTKQSVDEMIQILKKEADIHVESSFGDIVSVTSFFQKLIFQAYMFSLSHYLGHLRAGYYALEVQKQVHFHPSSSLLSLNAKPEWIVYTEFMKTTKDFIKCISIVEEGWVQEALQEGRLSFDMEEVKKRKIELVLREEIGLTMFRHLVGPKYLHLRELEEELSNSGMSTVVVEADREMGTIDIYSSSPMNSQVADNIKHCKQTILQTLVLEEDEIPLLKNTNGCDRTGFRVVLGQGAEVKSLLMPDESNKIIIRNSSFRTTEEEIRHKFSAFGEIVECIQFKSLNPWGFLRYKTKQEAQNAVTCTMKDAENAANFKIDNDIKKVQRKFEVKLTWCRRPIKGIGTAFIKCSLIDKSTFLDKYISLPNGKRLKLKMSNKGEDLICHATGRADEQVIKDSILSLVNYDKRISRHLSVTVLRIKVTATEHEVEDMKTLLSHELKKYSELLHLSNNTFEINMIQPKESSINYVGFIHFDKLSEGEQLCKFMQNRLRVQNKPVEICPRLKTTLYVPESIMKICRAEIDEIKDYLTVGNSVEVKIREMKKKDFAIDIRCTSAKCLVEARDLFQNKLDGEIVDCSISDLTRSVLKPEGLKKIKIIENRFKVLINVDKRKERIHIYGTFEDVVQTKIKILEYFEELKHAKKSDLLLSGNEKPQGLMKEIMKRFGDLHNGLIEHFHLMDAKIDFKQQKLSIFGSPGAVTQTENEIAAIEKDLASRVHQQTEKWLPDCVVCMCPVESCTELYRLEGCGHSYCHTCLKAMVSVAVEDKQFPVDCVKENCSLALVWKDLRFCLKQNWISESKLAQRSLDSLVAINSRRYKYCKTANCPVVYEVTEDVEGNEFNCPACLISLCTSCHSNYHVGLSCKMFVSQQDSNLHFEIWKREDPLNRKLCPVCSVPIEKNDGCNHMTCRDIISILSDLKQNIISILNDLKQNIISIVHDLKQDMISIVHDLKQNILSILNDLKQDIISILSDLKQDIISILSDLKQNILSILSDLKQNIISIVHDLKKDIISIVNDLKQNILSIVYDLKQNIISIVHDLKQNIISILNDLKQDILSILNYLKQNIIAIVHDLKQDIISIVHDLKQNILSILNDLKQDIISILSDLKQNILSMLNNLKQNIISIVQDLKQDMISIVHDLKQNILSILNDLKQDIISILMT
ncbi:ATP-dependent RNA helicase DEAH12, chloroplastic [Biomphalaria glabrata]|nr:ATP-dependent RNA helicase DEAH12, chloroplastic [Biomphalaria glabrata]